MCIKDILQNPGVVERHEALHIIAFALSMTTEEVLSRWDTEIGHERALYIQQLLDERAHGKPLAYITQNKEFFSEPFFVDERVLIPRPETELLVEIAIDIINTKPKPVSVVDVGTGSGAIGIVIARHTSQKVFCVDISWSALCVAQKNAIAHNLTHAIECICMDTLEGFKQTRYFDVIVANLPYISSNELKNLMKDVKDFEPLIALNGGVDGVEAYRNLCHLLPHHLKKDGYVICEVGGSQHRQRVQTLFEATGLNVRTQQDLAGIDRVLIGTWTNS